MKCPLCYNELIKTKDLGEGAKQCKQCKNVFFILHTSRPKIIVDYSNIPCTD